MMTDQETFNTAPERVSRLGRLSPSSQSPTRDARTYTGSDSSVVDSADEAFGKKFFDFVLAEPIFCTSSKKEFNGLFSGAIRDFPYNACTESIRSVAGLPAVHDPAQDHKRVLMGTIGAAIRQQSQRSHVMQQEIAAIVRKYGLVNAPNNRADGPLPINQHRADHQRFPSAAPSVSDDQEDSGPWQTRAVVAQRSIPLYDFTSMLNHWMQENGTNAGHQYKWSATEGWRAQVNVQGMAFTATRGKKMEAKHEASRRACEYLGL